MDRSGVLEAIRELAAPLREHMELADVDELLDRGELAVAAAQLKEHAQALGVSSPEYWAELEPVLRACELDGDADDCNLLARLFAGKVPDPFEALSDEARTVLALHADQQVGDVNFFGPLPAAYTQAMWEEDSMPLDGLVVIGEAPSGDVWVADVDAGEAVGVLSHDLVWEGEVTAPRDALIRVAENVAAFVTTAVSGALPIDYWAAREERPG